MVWLFFSLTAPSVMAGGGVSANSAVLMEQQSGRVLFAKDPHKKARIASITKIMTAILAIESDKLKENVKVSPRAVGTEGSSLYLKEGEKLPLEDLVYGLMLRSGNDAAVAIAEHVGGSKEGFVYLMNEKAKEIGMKHTYFANPHGLDDHEEHLSTAYDMALLTQYAMKNETYRKVAGTKVYRAPNPEEKWDRIWHNKNRLLTEKYEYCTGGKTGFTKRAKRTLVTTAAKGDMELIAVTLNAPDDWNDHIYMYESSFKTYDPIILLSEGFIDAAKDPIYRNKIYTKRDLFYPLKNKEEKDVSIRFKLMKPQKGWKEGAVPDVVGVAEAYLGKEKIDSTPVYYKQPQEKEEKSFWDKLKDGIFS
nr:D-alanyl-D-alanine carboxypeptidase family protein [Bacillus ectoiniformans]